MGFGELWIGEDVQVLGKSSMPEEGMEALCSPLLPMPCPMDCFHLFLNCILYNKSVIVKCFSQFCES